MNTFLQSNLCVLACALNYKAEKMARRRATLKIWREANREKYNERAAIQRRKNPESVRRAKKKHYESHKSEIIEKRREHFRMFPEQRRASEAKQREKFPEKYREKWKRNYWKDVNYSRMRHHQQHHSRKAKKEGRTFDKTANMFIARIRAMTTVPCYYCGKIMSGKAAHIDHIIAVAKNGNHASENLCAACPTCNTRKGAKLPSEITFVPQPLLNL